MKKLTVLILALFLGTLLIGCSGEPATPPLFNFDGVEVVLGEGSPSSFISKDFTVTTARNELLIGKLPAKSHLSGLLDVTKDKKSYAYIYVYNPASEEKFFDLCPIHKIDFTLPDDDSPNRVYPLLNGIDYLGMDMAAVKETMTDYKVRNETDDFLSYTAGSYRYNFSINAETGLVAEIKVSIPKADSYSSVSA